MTVPENPVPVKHHRWLISFAILAVLLVGGVIALRTWYNHNLQPLSAIARTTNFEVKNGAGVHQIASDLKQASLIRSPQAFETYVRSHNYTDKLQAGTYSLSPSLSVPQIVSKFINGDNSSLFTILPGQRLDQLKQAFRGAGYSQDEVNKAFNPAHYPGHPALASLPSGVSLEGYLYPDSYGWQPKTAADTIVRQSLDEMAKHLTSTVRAGFKAHGLSVYEGVTLSSIVAQETDDPAAQPTVAQVFYSRLKNGMMLGSDVTALYAAHQAGAGNSLGVDSPYNTRIHGGLPPGPISNITDSALKAVASPAHTDYLYFLFGDDKKMHFAHTDAEHQANIKRYCSINCAL